MSRALRFLPLLILIAFVGAVAWRLSSPADEKIPSKMIGKPVPAFVLAPALPGKARTVRRPTSHRRPRLVNVFASWCVPCIAEAPLLAGAKAPRACRSTASRFATSPRTSLPSLPVMAIRSSGSAPTPKAASSSRSAPSGVPESFIVDGRGIIRYQHIGADRARRM